MGPSSAVVLVAAPLLLLATLIVGPIEQSHGAPLGTIIDGPLTKGTDPRKTDTTVVHLIYYLSYLIDHLIRHYVPNWAMTSPSDASDYFDKALVQGSLDEPKEDGKPDVFKPKPDKAEKSVHVVHTISRS